MMEDTFPVTGHGWKCIGKGGNAVKGGQREGVVVLGQVEGNREILTP